MVLVGETSARWEGARTYYRRGSHAGEGKFVKKSGWYTTMANRSQKKRKEHREGEATKVRVQRRRRKGFTEEKKRKIEAVQSQQYTDTQDEAGGIFQET